MGEAGPSDSPKQNHATPSLTERICRARQCSNLSMMLMKTHGHGPTDLVSAPNLYQVALSRWSIYTEMKS